ncbi:hypothetical protein JCM17846_16670 [Iodidimonas nitroreducens]|uniref:Uncharacterized protein n=1 Tax=Iodidimonas nitroreducens TaxID=1236968 RepID=A0A5A7N8N5_9PROT|nr:hypothetical protein JCM17846_16670 [Iodidimonas nitroreducens]
MVLAKSPPLSVFAAPFSCFFLVLFFVVAALGGAAVPGARASDDPAFSGAEAAFPHALNPFGLKPDPAVRWGRLDHGLRYALMRNETPRDQLSFYLRVDVGSLDEQPDQGELPIFWNIWPFKNRAGTLMRAFFPNWSAWVCNRGPIAMPAPDWRRPPII